jgi:hypothetical protein
LGRTPKGSFCSRESSPGKKHDEKTKENRRSSLGKSVELLLEQSTLTGPPLQTQNGILKNLQAEEKLIRSRISRRSALEGLADVTIIEHS